MNYEAFEENYMLEETYWWFVGRRKIINTLINKYLKRSRTGLVLDVGCGTGYYLTQLEKFGTPIGIDISPLAIAFSKRRTQHEIMCADVCLLPFPNNTFEIVTMLGVLYNGDVKNDDRAIEEAVRVLKPQGLLIIDEAAYECLHSRHNTKVNGSRRYTKKKLIQKCKIHGTKICQATYWNVLTLPFYALFVICEKFTTSNQLQRFFKLPSLLNSFLAFYLYMESLILQCISFPLGSSVLIVAQKEKTLS